MKRDRYRKYGVTNGVKFTMKKLKDKNWYYIGFVGTDNFVYVGAYTVKEAKQKFADHFGINVSAYIVAKKSNLAHLSNYTGLKIR